MVCLVQLGDDPWNEQGTVQGLWLGGTWQFPTQLEVKSSNFWFYVKSVLQVMLILFIYNLSELNGYLEFNLFMFNSVWIYIVKNYWHCYNLELLVLAALSFKKIHKNDFLYVCGYNANFISIYHVFVCGVCWTYSSILVIISRCN